MLSREELEEFLALRWLRVWGWVLRVGGVVGWVHGCIGLGVGSIGWGGGEGAAAEASSGRRCCLRDNTTS